MGLIADLDQLDVDAHLVAGALHAAFQHILHIERAADLGDRLAGDNPRGGRGNHAEVRRIELAEFGADDIGKARGDVVGLGIAAEVSEG